MITSLFNFALEHGIQIKASYNLSKQTPSVADTSSSSILINLNCENQRQLPFIIAHEISHILTCDEDDAQLCFSTLMDTKYEYRANCGAVKLLIPYYVDAIDELEQLNVKEFMDLFVIPNNMYNVCVSEIKNYVKQ